MVLDPTPVDALQAAQEVLQALNVPPKPSITAMQKAHHVAEMGEAVIGVIQVLVERARAEIKSGNPGNCCDNLFAFIHKNVEHNAKALAVLALQKTGPAIIIAKDLPPERRS